VELLREEGNAVGPLLEQYARVLAGLDDGRGTWRRLQALDQLGVTRGTLSLL
jgi:putative protease